MNIDFNKYFNLSKLSKEQQQLFIGAVIDLVLARMADKIGEHLTEAELVELENLSQSNNSEAVIGWVNARIPNFSQGINEILAEESESIGRKVAALSDQVFKEPANART